MAGITYYLSPIGIFKIKSSNLGVTNVHFSGDRISGEEEIFCHHVEMAKQQMEEFFNGKRTTFTVPLDLSGSNFQLAIWQEIKKIMPGKTDSYKNLADYAGSPRAARAVGMACNKNPVPIIIPCHRVVGSDGAMRGFAFGLDKKEWLLQFENSIYKQPV